MSAFTETKKWVCNHCTYENWPASKKCTMCRRPRTPQYISDEAPGEKDIYKLVPLICQETSSSEESSLPSSLDPNNKWPCQTCTYLNWPKTVRCVQCLNPRNKSEENQSLSGDVQLGTKTESGSKINSPKTLANSPEATKEINNDKNRSLGSTSPSGNGITPKPGKWTCKACTYENWPRSMKCTLCGVLKGRRYTEGGSTTQDDSSASDSDVKKTSPPHSLKKRSSPSGRPSSCRNTESPDIYHLGGATAAPQTNYNCEKQDKNKEDESRTPVDSQSSVRKVRTMIRESGWLWLNACKGVVEGDSQAIEAFLATGGDASRQLTAEECAILNRPSAFQVGYTLVHLAVRFQREDILTALLTASDAAKKAKKKVPSHVAPDLASEILRDISIGIRRRKGDFPCYFLSDFATFALPAGLHQFFLIVLHQYLNGCLSFICPSYVGI